MPGSHVGRRHGCRAREEGHGEAGRNRMGGGGTADIVLNGANSKVKISGN